MVSPRGSNVCPFMSRPLCKRDLLLTKQGWKLNIKEKQDRLPTLHWLPKLHKRPYKARFIAIYSSCTTTVLSKLLNSRLTAVKNIGLDTMILFTKGTELTMFGQLKIPILFSIDLNLNTFRLLNCLHMMFLHCILRYLIVL